MRTIKTYETNGVSYSFVPAYRKWEFRFGNGSSLLSPSNHGGAIVAHKIAKQIAGSVKRSGGLDNLARRQIGALSGQN